MEIGDAISAKIREAIKAKLIDLGAYVDDELPDYIMVMVANKKSEMQMTEDLSLFLGGNTETFTSWLQNWLTKLQSLDAAKKASLERNSNSNKMTSQSTRSREQALEPEIEVNVKSDEFAEEVEETEKKNNMKNQSTHKTVLHIKTETKQRNTSGESEHRSAARNESKVSRKQSPVRTSSSKGLPRSAVTERASSIHSSDVNRKRKVLGSMIGSVIHRPDDDEEEDAYDPFRPSIGNVASVIRIGERRPSVPKSLQANKSLLMKAMEEAHKSLANKRMTGVEIEQSRPKALVSQSRRREMISRLKEEIRAEDSDESFGPETSLDDYFSLTTSSVDDTRRFQSSDLDSDYEPELEGLKESDDERNDSRRIVQNKNPKPKPSSPKFIVTLDGVDPKALKSGTVKDDASISDMDADVSANNESDVYISYTASESEDEAENCTSPVKKAAKIIAKCKFWPDCKNGTSCTYHHPTISCKSFPKCRYGDKCVYIHPNCKFNANCSKPNCPFSHKIKKNTTMEKTVIPKAFILTKPKFLSVMPYLSAPTAPVPSTPTNPREIQCKFYPKCTNMNCPYKHPMVCRFGMGCHKRLTGCSFYHPPLPSANQLKWTKDITQSQHISDRHFAQEQSPIIITNI